MGTTEHRALQIVREHLAQPDAAVGFDALRRAVSQEGPSSDSIRDLANRVGGLKALELLDAVPVGDEPFDWSVVVDTDRPFVEGVVGALDDVCDLWLDVEYRTITRRLLARVLTKDPKPLRRSSSPRRIAAGIVLATLSSNNEIGRRAKGRWTANDVAWWFGVTSVGDVARTLVRAAQFDLAYDNDRMWPDVPPDEGLRSVDLLHSDTRRNFLTWRSSAIASFEKEEQRRAGRRPMVDLGDGRVQMRSCLVDVALVHKGLSETGRIMVLVGLAPLMPEPELELYALSVPDARHLASLLNEVLAERPPPLGLCAQPFR